MSLDMQFGVPNSLMGMPVYESPFVQDGQAVILNGGIWVQDMWKVITLPLMVSKAKRQAQDHLKALVDDVCKRWFEGCCTTCDGRGRDIASPETNGKCWDCYGTGHIHL